MLGVDRLRQKARRHQGLEAPGNWREWLPVLFPHLFYHPFVKRHEEFWSHIESIKPLVKPPAFFAIWGRGGSKSTNAEAAAVYLGAKKVRRFALYIRSIQDKANESVQNISAMLESDQVAEFYPALTKRKLGKYGNSKGWRIDTLRCESGYNVVALGFDAAVRGVKIEEYRPDVIFIDDIDEKGDTLAATEKKVSILTRNILPSGSSDVAVIGIQNLINYDGIFSRISSGKADFLLDRVVSGPYSAVNDLEYEYSQEKRRYFITGGTPTWPGQNLETCEAQINEWGIDAFLEEAQNIVTLKKGRVFHGYTGPGPDAKTLDLGQAQGFWHAHDFGGTNEIWGLFVRIAGVYYLILEQVLPEATTARRAEIVKETIRPYLAGDIDRHKAEMIAAGDTEDLDRRAFEAAWREKVVAGYGGAKSEKQIRADYKGGGLEIQPPKVSAVESQINTANEMLKGERGDKLVICSGCIHTIDHLGNCIRDPLGKILNESAFHYAAMVRYFCAGVGSGLHWAR